MRETRTATTRKDGWTAARQLRFLDTLASTCSVTRAAAAAGMSRESAHRLRNRRDGALFAAIWDIALAPAPPLAGFGFTESHIAPPRSGQLMRVLGNHFRRKSGDFHDVGSRTAEIRKVRQT